MAVHSTAIVDPAAIIHDAADIGPYCIIGADVEIGARTRLMANLFVEGPAVIGEDNVFFPYSTVGVASQDRKYRGERAWTRIGGDNLLMTYTHVAHDCRIGNHVILGNSVGLAGHVTIEDWADVSPFSGVHQFCRIGRHAFIGPYSVIKQDVMPYSLTSNKPGMHVFGANSVGLSRRGLDKAAIESLQTAFRLLTRAGLNTSQAVERIQAEVEPCPEVGELLTF